MGRDVPPGYEKRFNEALALEREDRTDDALAILLELNAEVSGFSPTLKAIAGIYLHRKRAPELALPWYQEAVQAGPRSEHASMGLFLCLYRLGRGEEALAEMDRFTAIKHSPAYEQLVRDLDEAIDDDGDE